MKRSRLDFKYLFLPKLLLLCSCSQVDYSQKFKSQSANSSFLAESGNQNPAFEKEKFKTVYRKSNLEALSIGRNRLEIQNLMGEPEGKSLDGGNGYLWDYRRPVLDEATGEIFGWSLISFKFLKGLCAYVNIRLETLPAGLQKTKSNPLRSL
jgi:hypothetical protein